MKRSLQPIRHANRRAQAAVVVRDFTSAPVNRSPFSFGDALKEVNSSVSSAVQNGVDVVKSAPKKLVDKAKSLGKSIVKGGERVEQKAVDATDNLVDGAGKQIGKIIASGIGAVEDFVDSVRTCRAFPFIGTDHML